MDQSSQYNLRDRNRINAPSRYDASCDEQSSLNTKIARLRQQCSAKKKSIIRRIGVINDLIKRKGSRTKIIVQRNQLQTLNQDVSRLHTNLMDLMPEDNDYDADWIEELSTIVDDCSSNVEEYLVERIHDPPSDPPSRALSEADPKDFDLDTRSVKSDGEKPFQCFEEWHKSNSLLEEMTTRLTQFRIANQESEMGDEVQKGEILGIPSQIEQYTQEQPFGVEVCEPEEIASFVNIARSLHSHNAPAETEMYSLKDPIDTSYPLGISTRPKTSNVIHMKGPIHSFSQIGDDIHKINSHVSSVVSFQEFPSNIKHSNQHLLNDQHTSDTGPLMTRNTDSRLLFFPAQEEGEFLRSDVRSAYYNIESSPPVPTSTTHANQMLMNQPLCNNPLKEMLLIPRCTDHCQETKTFHKKNYLPLGDI